MTDMIVRDQIALTLHGAQTMLAAAVAHANAMGVPECIAIVDPGGLLLAFARMDEARIGSIEIALKKAISAATRKRATADEGGGEPLLGIKLALASTIVQIGGGLPILVDGQTIGGIGVSSGTVPEDLAVAEAGLAALRTA